MHNLHGWLSERKYKGRLNSMWPALAHKPDTGLCATVGMVGYECSQRQWEIGQHVANLNAHLYVFIAASLSVHTCITSVPARPLLLPV